MFLTWFCVCPTTTTTSPLVHDCHAAKVSRDECLHLNDILGVKTLPTCYNVKHAIKADDRFTTHNEIGGGNTAQQDDDEVRHRNSWLMPRMARRMTRDSKHHVTNWRQKDVSIDEADCARLRALLTEKMGSPADAEDHLPAACRRM